MMNILKYIQDKLGCGLPIEVVDEAVDRASKKMKDLLDRGCKINMNHEEYLAILVAEDIRHNAISHMTFSRYDIERG